jgi:hypothetical protein
VTGVLGSLAGIGEIAKATFGGDHGGSTPAAPARRPTGPSSGFATPGYTPPTS